MKTLLKATGICLSVAAGLTPLLTAVRPAGPTTPPPAIGAHARAVFADPLHASTLSCHRGAGEEAWKSRSPGRRVKGATNRPEEPVELVFVDGREATSEVVLGLSTDR